MAGCSGCMGRLFFFSSRRRHTRFSRDWSSDVCSSDLVAAGLTHHPYRSDVHGLLEQGTKEAIILEGGHVQVPAEKRPAIVAKPATKGTAAHGRLIFRLIGVRWETQWRARDGATAGRSALFRPSGREMVSVPRGRPGQMP